MPHIRHTALYLLSALALAALFASSAVAASPAWWVAGSLLKSSEKEALAATTKVLKAFVFKNSQITVECRSLELEKSAIEGEKTRTDHSMIFKECTDVSEPACTISAIKTLPLTSTLEGTSPNFTLKFKPTSGTEVATIKLGGTCTGSFVVSGTMICEYPEVGTEQLEHKLEFTKTSGTNIKIGSITGEFTGSDDVKLASEKNWSVK